MKLVVFVALAGFLVSCLPVTSEWVTAGVKTAAAPKAWGRAGPHAPPPRLAQAPKVAMPSRVSNLKVLPTHELRSLLSCDEFQAIHAFTRHESDDIRACQMHTLDELRREDWDLERFYQAKGFCRNLAKAAIKLPNSPGTVYRGINEVEAKELFRLEKLRETGDLMNLGPENLATWVSASRSAPKAVEYSLYGVQHPHHYRILYEIQQHSGDSVEKASAFPQDLEVLIPPTALFRVKGLEPVEGADDLVLVKVEEARTIHDLQREGMARGKAP